MRKNEQKTVLARACDPIAAEAFAKMIPAHIGGAKYVATTNDHDFIKQLNTAKWSVVFFAPGACRLSAAGMPIPGRNDGTQGWTIEDYEKVIKRLQGNMVKIVRAYDETDTIELLITALEKARDIH